MYPHEFSIESDAFFLFFIGVVVVLIIELVIGVAMLYEKKEARNLLILHTVLSALTIYLSLALLCHGHGLIFDFQWQGSCLLALFGFIWAMGIFVLIRLIDILLNQKQNEDDSDPGKGECEEERP